MNIKKIFIWKDEYNEYIVTVEAAWGISVFPRGQKTNSFVV